MANSRDKSIKRSVMNTKMILTRGHISDQVKENIQDGEVFFDMDGEGILMGVYQGAGQPIKVVEISAGGGSGTITEEQLATLISTSDIREENGILYIGKVGSQYSAAAASDVASLKATVVSNTTRISALENLMQSGITDEAKQYIKQIIETADFSDVDASPIQVVTKVQQEETVVTLDVKTDNTIGTVTDEAGKASLGTVWASYENETDDSSSDDTGSTVDGEGFGDDLVANIIQ